MAAGRRVLVAWRRPSRRPRDAVDAPSPRFHRHRLDASASPRPFLAGGLPGYFPPIAGRAGFGQVGFNLYDPFNWFDAAYPGKDKVQSPVSINAIDGTSFPRSNLLTD